MSKVSGGCSSVKSKAVYRVKNWSSYNRALVARGSLTVWLDDSLWKRWYAQGPCQRGAQFVYSDRTMEWMLTMRVLLRLPLRQTQGFIQSLLDLMGMALAVPDYSTLSRRHGSLAVMLPCQRCDKPMHVVVDSTRLESLWGGRVESASTRLDQTADVAQAACGRQRGHRRGGRADVDVPSDRRCLAGRPPADPSRSGGRGDRRRWGL